MARPKSLSWITVIMVCVGTGAICWGLMYPIDYLLEWKEIMNVSAYLPRGGVPVAVVGVSAIGLTMLYAGLKGVLSQRAVLGILEFMLVAFIGFAALEFFTAKSRCLTAVIQPSAAAHSNSVASAPVSVR